MFFILATNCSYFMSNLKWEKIKCFSLPHLNNLLLPKSNIDCWFSYCCQIYLFTSKRYFCVFVFRCFCSYDQYMRKGTKATLEYEPSELAELDFGCWRVLFLGNLCHSSCGWHQKCFSPLSLSRNFEYCSVCPPAGRNGS